MDFYALVRVTPFSQASFQNERLLTLQKHVSRIFETVYFSLVTMAVCFCSHGFLSAIDQTVYNDRETRHLQEAVRGHTFYK